MNKFDSAKLRTRIDNTSEGLLVQVYSGDRRLLCVLDSSHAWTFFWGGLCGLLLAVGWVNLASYSPSATYEPPTIPPKCGLISPARANTESALASPGWAGQTPFAPTQAACLESGL